MAQKILDAIFKGPSDIEAAQKVINLTVGVSVFVIILTAALSIAGFYKSSEDETLNYLLDPWLLVDVLLMIVFTFFLYKRKIWAPIALVIHLIIGIIVIYIDLKELPGSISLFKLLLFISAIRAVRFIGNEAR